MSEQAVVAAPAESEDAAWASVNTPLSAEVLKTFCQVDVERLFRINPMLEFKQWKQLDNNRYLFSAKNISQETPFEFETEVNVSETPNGLRVDYSNGIKSSTEFNIEPVEQGARLTITDRYEGLSEAERQEHLGEVDKSITVWAEYLQRFLIDWKKWSRFGLWRWYMRRVWQPMKPSGRRITYILLWITVVEIALIILGAGIYFAEYA
jgi:hypothetical protein